MDIFQIHKIFSFPYINEGLVPSIVNNNVILQLGHYDYDGMTFEVFYLFTILLYMILIIIQERISQYVFN